jgi:methionine-rich copper-binding protein CopC
MKIKILAIASALVVSLAAAHAGTTGKGPNGGKVIEVAGHNHIEFVPAAAEVTFYATDGANKPIATAGAKGRVVIQSGGKTVQKDLTPAAPNKLTTPLDAPLVKGAVAVISVTFSDGHAVQGRFTID